jgi:hypothetical protein
MLTWLPIQVLAVDYSASTRSAFPWKLDKVTRLVGVMVRLPQSGTGVDSNHLPGFRRHDGSLLSFLSPNPRRRWNNTLRLQGTEWPTSTSPLQKNNIGMWRMTRSEDSGTQPMVCRLHAGCLKYSPALTTWCLLLPPPSLLQDTEAQTWVTCSRLTAGED